MPQNDGRQFAALLSTMRRADTIAKGAIAVSRRRQLARTPDESTAKESAIAYLVRRNNPRLDGPPTG